MFKFKPGDTVVRVKGDHSGMHVGDTATVKEMERESCMLLAEFGGGHDPQMFNLYKSCRYCVHMQNITGGSSGCELKRCKGEETAKICNFFKHIE